jgi:hypothetical protein
MIPTREDVIQQTRAQMLAIINSASASTSHKIQAGAVLAKLEGAAVSQETSDAKSQRHKETLSAAA